VEGQKKERTNWHNVTIWTPGLINTLEKFIGQGEQVLVQGSLNTRTYNDKDGKKCYFTDVVVSVSGKVIMLGGPKGDCSKSPVTHEFGDGQMAFDDDEIPF